MKTTMTKPISPRQLGALQAALRAIGISERQERLDWLSAQTGRPVGSTKELTFDEARALLSSLNEGQDKAKEMLRREAARIVGDIYRLSFLIPWLNQDYSGLDTPEDEEMNKAKLSAWTRRYSGCRKPISRMDVNELKAVRKQMRQIVRKLEQEEAGGTAHE